MAGSWIFASQTTYIGYILHFRHSCDSYPFRSSWWVCIPDTACFLRAQSLANWTFAVRKPLNNSQRNVWRFKLQGERFMQPSRLWMRSGLHRCWTFGVLATFAEQSVNFLEVWLGQSTQYCSQDNPSLNSFVPCCWFAQESTWSFANLASVESLRCLCQESFKPTRVVENDACGSRITLIRRKMQWNSSRACANPCIEEKHGSVKC